MNASRFVMVVDERTQVTDTRGVDDNTTGQRQGKWMTKPGADNKV